MKATMRYTILVVDDEARNREYFKTLLEAEGFGVILAADARQALLAVEDSSPDLVLSDVSMPGEDGVAFCRRLRSRPKTASIPMILMSGVHKGETKQAEGIEEGADDYLVKPFSPVLLYAKVRSVLRRYDAPEELGETLKDEGLKLDVGARVVTVNDKKVNLTRKEFDLLTTFLRKKGRVVSSAFLLETVWGYDPADYNDPRTVTVHISSLRKKMGAKLADRIVSVSGLGYRFD